MPGMPGTLKVLLMRQFKVANFKRPKHCKSGRRELGDFKEESNEDAGRMQERSPK